MGKKSKRKPSKGASKSPLEFQIDDRVTLKGLQSLQHNGKHGTIVSLPTKVRNEERRFGVRLDGSNRPIGVKPCNIERDIDPSLWDCMSTDEQLRARREDQYHVQCYKV